MPACALCATRPLPASQPASQAARPPRCAALHPPISEKRISRKPDTKPSRSGESPTMPAAGAERHRAAQLSAGSEGELPLRGRAPSEAGGCGRCAVRARRCPEAARLCRRRVGAALCGALPARPAQLPRVGCRGRWSSGCSSGCSSGRTWDGEVGELRHRQAAVHDVCRMAGPGQQRSRQQRARCDGSSHVVLRGRPDHVRELGIPTARSARRIDRAAPFKAPFAPRERQAVPPAPNHRRTCQGTSWCCCSASPTLLPALPRAAARASLVSGLGQLLWKGAEAHAARPAAGLDASACMAAGAATIAHAEGGRLGWLSGRGAGRGRSGGGLRCCRPAGAGRGSEGTGGTVGSWRPAHASGADRWDSAARGPQARARAGPLAAAERGGARAFSAFARKGRCRGACPGCPAPRGHK
jgi:hypothetical protein